MKDPASVEVYNPAVPGVPTQLSLSRGSRLSGPRRRSAGGRTTGRCRSGVRLLFSQGSSGSRRDPGCRIRRGTKPDGLPSSRVPWPALRTPREKVFSAALVGFCLVLVPSGGPRRFWQPCLVPEAGHRLQMLRHLPLLAAPSADRGQRPGQPLRGAVGEAREPAPGPHPEDTPCFQGRCEQPSPILIGK